MAFPGKRSSEIARTAAVLLLAGTFVLALGLLVPAFAQVPDIPNIRCPMANGTYVVIPNDGRPCPADPTVNGGGGQGGSTGATPTSIAIAAAAGAAVVGTIVGTVKKTRARVPTGHKPEHVPSYPRGSGRAQQRQHVHGRGSYEWETPDPPPDLPPAPLIGDSAPLAQPLYTGTVSNGTPDPAPASNTLKDVKSIKPDPIKTLRREIDEMLRALDDAFARGEISPKEHHARTVAARQRVASWLPAAGAAAAAGGAGYVVTSRPTGAAADAPISGFCPGCGASRASQAKFCRKCGRTLA